MIVHRRFGAGGNDQREQRQRSVFGAIERVLPDAAAHPARVVRRGVLRRQPAVAGEQRRERRFQRLDARARVADRRGEPPRLVDERTNGRRVDEIAKGVMRMVLQVAHGRILP